MNETFTHLPRDLQIRVLCKLASRDRVRLLGSSLITVPNNFRYELVDVCGKLDLNDNRSSVILIVRNQPRVFLFIHFKEAPCLQLTLMVDMLNISSNVIHTASLQLCASLSFCVPLWHLDICKPFADAAVLRPIAPLIMYIAILSNGALLTAPECRFVTLTTRTAKMTATLYRVL